MEHLLNDITGLDMVLAMALLVLYLRLQRPTMDWDRRPGS